MRYIWPEGLYIQAGGFANRLRRDMVIAAKPQTPKIRIENHKWFGVDESKMASGMNFKIKPLDRDELVKSCDIIIDGKDRVLLNEAKICGLLDRIKKITGIEIRSRGSFEKSENSLSFYKDPNGTGYYELDVAGFSERTSVVIPKKRNDRPYTPLNF